MRERKVIGPIISPLLGTIPVLVFMLMDWMFSFPIALGGSFVAFSLLYVVFHFIYKQKAPYTLILNLFIYFLVIGLSFIPYLRPIFKELSSVAFELSLIVVYATFYTIKDYYRKKIGMGTEKHKESRLIRFDFDVHVIRIFLFITIAHLLIVYTYQMLLSEAHSIFQTNFIIYYSVFFLLVSAYFLYETTHIILLRKELKTESWLPIVDENGGVHGKIASSISKEFKNKYLHPIVRISLTHNGRVFLRERKQPVSGRLKQLDTPFESPVLFKESLGDAVKNAFKNNGSSIDSLPHIFLCKYTLKNEANNHLVYLYSCNILDESLLEKIDLSNGKWWTCKQIEENTDTGVFSEYFEKEYELLKCTVITGGCQDKNKTA